VKAFLMYRDRDFDPQALLSRKKRVSRFENPDQEEHLQQLLPWNEKALTQDLRLDILFNAMADGDEFLFDVAKVALLSSLTDRDTVLYRQHILSDCLKHAAIVTDIYQIAKDAIEEERKNFLGYFSRHPKGILHRSVEVLEMFMVRLRRLRDISEHEAEHFESEGFTRLHAMLRQELTGEYFTSVENHLKQLQFRNGVLISAGLGRGNKGTNYVLRKPHKDTRSWTARLFPQRTPAYTFRLHPRDEAGARALSELEDEGLNLVANALAQATDHILSFFQMLRTELAFYIACLNLRARLFQMQAPACLPIPASPCERRLSFSGLYDVCLALTLGKKIVGNDLSGREKSLFIITGANTGGKSTFLRSIGLAYLMMQAGMFVPAESFSSEICDGLFTHFRREEDLTMESGKWDEELSRMSEIVDNLNPNAVILFNESFASTNEREGSEVASQIVRALLNRRIKVFFVTHLLHFAHSFFDERLEEAIFLRAERRPDGTRPFKLSEAEPLRTSYGEDLYNAIFVDRPMPRATSSEKRP